MGLLWVCIPSPLESTPIACGNDSEPSLVSEQIGLSQQYVPLNSLVIECILAWAKSMAGFWFQRKEALQFSSFLTPLPELRIPH